MGNIPCATRQGVDDIIPKLSDGYPRIEASLPYS